MITATFSLNGQKFIALNGGPQFTFTEAVSLYVNCETQEEVDYLWQKLTDGGKKEPVAGSKINMVCHGKSCQMLWEKYWPI